MDNRFKLDKPIRINNKLKGDLRRLDRSQIFYKEKHKKFLRGEN